MAFIPTRAFAASNSASRVLKNSFFDALPAIQGWVANFDES
ncbi:MAG: hypothetical protein ACYC4A_07065 [Desulfobulbia bacterium]